MKHAILIPAAVATSALLVSALVPISAEENRFRLGLAAITDEDYYAAGRYPDARVELGRLLFFDKLLSGNRNVSCATCHHPELGTTDGLALGLGEGAVGLGPTRRADEQTPVLGRIPRNSPALYNLGTLEHHSLFHDGRVEKDAGHTWESGFWSPAREQLPTGLENVLAAQAMFPVASPIEMAGHKGENPVADAAAADRLAGTDGVWDLLAQRIRAIPEYVALFQEAFDDVDAPGDLTFVHAANAIAAFETVAFRADDSPFDHYLRDGDPAALSSAARHGMELFHDKAGCARCHSGKFQTDQQFHAIGMPQIGPGKHDGFDHDYWEATGFVGRLEDFGRFRVTQNPRDKYRFRTPGLRNVAITGPWGHSGAYETLEGAVRHHMNPVAALRDFSTSDLKLPPIGHVIEASMDGSALQHRPVNPQRLEDYLRRDTWLMSRPSSRNALAEKNELRRRALSDEEVSDLIEFLHALTDPRSRSAGHLVPDRVPSGLPVEH